MIANEKNLAYDISALEAPELRREKRDNILEMPQHEKEMTARRKKPRAMLAAGPVLMLSISAFIVGSIVFNQVQITEITDKTYQVTKKLEESRSEHTQLQMKVKEKLSPVFVENYARNKLAMEKVTPSQVEYFSLSSGDKAELTQNTGQSLWGKFLKLLGIR